MQAINEAVFKITGKSPLTMNQCVAELTAFLHSKGAGDLIVDDDFQTLIELASIYAGKEEVVDRHIISIIKRSDPQLSQRTGPQFQPQSNQDQRYVIENMIRRIEQIHPDLHGLVKKDGFAMLDNKRTVFYINHIREILGTDEHSARLTFPHIKRKDELIHLICQPFLEEKIWAFRGESPRCEGRYFTIEETLQLLMDRKIITYGTYK